MKVILRCDFILIAIVLVSTTAIKPVCLAQEQDRPREKIGLVLSGGGARGAAHVGVIKVLDELRIPIDYIAGTSMGAIIGGLYASGMSASELEQVASNTNWTRLLADKPPRSRRTFRRKSDDAGFLVNFEMGLRKRKLLFPKGLVQGQTLSLELRKLLGNVITINEFDDLPIPFRAIAANIVSGEEVVLSSGDLAKSIRASMSVPGIFKPVEINGNLLVDGGIVNNLPIDIVKKMGADIVIVVDVGTLPEEQQELNSPLKITSQMLTILIKQQSDKQKELMSPTDFLITPELGHLSGSAFDQSLRAIRIGEQTARKSIEHLDQLSLPTPAYTNHRIDVRNRRKELPTIKHVAIENQSRLSSEVIQKRLSNHLGKPLDADLLTDEITNIHGFETFESVDYSIVVRETGNELHLKTESKDWGPNYLRLGINLEDNFEGTSNYNLAARLTRTEINKLGGELRADIVIGDSPELSIELYQPLDYASRWFFNPKVQYRSSSSGLFENDNQLAVFRSEDTNLSLGIGRNFGNTSELRFSLIRSYADSKVQIGDPLMTETSNDLTSFDLSFQYDTIDRLAIPRSGSFFSLSWSGLREGLESDQSVDLASLFFLKPQTWGKNTLLHWWNVGGVINEDKTPVNAFSLGGLFSLSGYSAGELVGQHSAIGRVLYYRRLGNGVTSPFDTPLYLGLSFEAGNVWQESNDISFSDLLYAGSAFVVVDTLLGPLYLAYGTAEGGQDSAYLFLGQTF